MRLRITLLVLAAALGAGGCGYDEAVGTPSDSGATTDSDPCAGFPTTLERTCTSATQCAIGLHQIDCCGTLVALGMQSTERVRFDAAESTCRAMFPACGCPPGPVTADTGQTALDAAAIEVDCVGGACTTLVPGEG